MSKNYYIIPIFVPQEGCPHKCVFCNQDKITGLEDIVDEKTVRNTIEDHLKTINNEYATIEVSFFGGTFTGIEEEKQRAFLKIAKEYKDKGMIDNIRLSTRPDYINDYILAYLKEYSVDIIELGVQSLDNDILKSAGRGHDVEDVIRASALIKEYGFILGHQIMPGLPNDTFEKDLETTKLSIQMQPHICRIYPALVIKDTPMEAMYKSGKYKPYTVQEAVSISKTMYDMYKEAGINIIRIGLQPTESIAEGKDVVGGPFHPAFRELVEGSLLVDKVLSKMGEYNVGILDINPRDCSKIYANKKMYFKKFKESNKIITVKQNNRIDRGNAKLTIKGNEFNIIF